MARHRRSPPPRAASRGPSRNRPLQSGRSHGTNAAAQRRRIATEEGLAEIGERIARLRKERGITQVEMAELLGLSQPVVSDYERGALRLHGQDPPRLRR